MGDLMAIIQLLILVETDGRINQVGDNGLAVGCLQIHPVMVKEANRILRKPRFFVNRDRLSKRKSKEIAFAFLDHQRKRYFDKFGEHPDALQLACSWNTGSIFKKMPAAYILRVQEVISRTKEEVK